MTENYQFMYMCCGTKRDEGYLAGTGRPQCHLTDIKNISSDSRKHSPSAAVRLFKAQEIRSLRSVGLLEVRANKVTQPKAYTVRTHPTLRPHSWEIASFHQQIETLIYSLWKSIN